MLFVLLSILKIFIIVIDYPTCINHQCLGSFFSGPDKQIRISRSGFENSDLDTDPTYVDITY